MKQRIGLFANLQNHDAMHWAEYSARRLLELGAEVCSSPEIAARFPREVGARILVHPVGHLGDTSDIIVTFGGDGTMLSAAQRFLLSGVPLMGVNVGKLGFLAEFGVHELDSALQALLQGNYRIVDRTVLEAEVRQTHYYALNDIVVEKHASPRMTRLRAYINEHHIADYRADGLIITTPTGSTAYSLSCGGPIIAPNARVVCLTPICPHMLTLRALVIPDDCLIRIEVLSDDGAVLVPDGQRQEPLSMGETVTVRLSPHVLKLVKHAQSSYFDLLRRKLLWAADAIGGESAPKGNY
ncbi:MAG: NAD(+)/NADH kinase [Candidatus Kapabacteria bacterium]|nr:NAD(+)/NADH kinase [Candidatus Kapabacteria bacterium]MCS7169720.1 NAD(+)/NADH kinase [Candidatus Kapabacteria bacterium]MDW7996357.1 NAD(+)/NADH kinase [Bacteroidota bacterium]MDW8224955.1 NAD(+)/NADH kinase [Bacteroidota bacterium]